MNRVTAEARLREAMHVGRWEIRREYSHGTSMYFHLRHSARAPVTVRVSDHNARARKGEKLLSVIGHGSLNNTCAFLRSARGARAQQVRPRRPHKRKRARDFHNR